MKKIILILLIDFPFPFILKFMKRKIMQLIFQMLQDNPLNLPDL